MKVYGKYNKTKKLIDKIEKKYNAKVVIACHPKSNYKIEDNFFNNRTLINHKTENLIKFSKFVITHGSTAISYAILYEKPILTILANHYGARYKREILPVTENITSQILGLPMFYKITREQQEYVVENLKY